MPSREILLLGNPRLYETSEPIRKTEIHSLDRLIEDLHDTLLDFREKHGIGRAIAAPQIGVQKRLFFMLLDTPVVLINPRIEDKSQEMIEVWDDCMCFPDLLVRVLRHKACSIFFRDLNWSKPHLELEGDLSELIQHECDHLDGILAVSRAMDGKSFALRSQVKNNPDRLLQSARPGRGGKTTRHR